MVRPATPGASTPGTSQVRLPQASVRISFFKLSRDPTNQMLVTPITGGGSSAPDNTATVNAGEEYKLRWIIEGCHATNVTTQLRGWNLAHTSHTSPSETNNRRERPNDCFEISGYSTLRDTEDRDYVLLVTASKPGAGRATDERTFHIRVKKPRLVLERPEVNMGDLTVKFFLANRGEADYPAPGVHLTGSYAVTNWNRHITYASGSLYQHNLALPKGGRVEIGRVTMTDREHLYAATKILVEAQADDQYGFLSGADRTVSYLHEWETRTTTLDADLLLSFFEALTGELKLNNYRSPGSNTTRTRPGVSNDSFVEIMDERRIFTPEFISAKLIGSASGNVLFDYRPYINNVTATIGGRRTTSIPDKNIVNLHIIFNTSGGPEIKGWRYRNNEYNDSDAPDIDLTKLELDVKFHLNLRNGKLIIDTIWIVPTLDLNATQDWSWLLNKLKPWLERMATNEISRYFGQLVNTADLRNRMNAEIATALSVLRVDWIHSFELNSTGLTMTYIPGH